MSRPEPPAPIGALPSRKREGFSARRFGLYVLFVSLSVLFAASLVGFFFTRVQSPLWRTSEMPALPAGLWLSTLLAVLMSATFQSALVAVRKNLVVALVRRLWFGAGFVALFLFAQTQNWIAMERGLFGVSVRTLYPYTFYLLTGLHAAHVVGGILPLALVIQRARRREYSSSRHEGVLLCVHYWHYLGAVWLVLFSVLEFSS